jgi:hypothetical protein
MVELTSADMQQQYLNNVVLMDGIHVKVVRVNEDKTLRVIHIQTGKAQDRILFNQDRFKAPNFRLGMCTYNGSTAYVTRVPVRKMGIGLSSENIDIARVGRINDFHGFIEDISDLVGESIYNTFIGKYLDLATAAQTAKLHGDGVVAFDRQMAVDCNENIYYKDRNVGKYVVNSDKAPYIAFSKNYSYLNKILGCNYETSF